MHESNNPFTSHLLRRQQFIMPRLFEAAERGKWEEEEFLEPGDDINATVSISLQFIC